MALEPSDEIFVVAFQCQETTPTNKLCLCKRINETPVSPSFNFRFDYFALGKRKICNGTKSSWYLRDEKMLQSACLIIMSKSEDR